MKENNTNQLPKYKLGQILSWNAEFDHAGFKGIIEVSAVIQKIVISKEHLHLEYLRPNFVYTLVSTKDPNHKWEIEQFHLDQKNPSVFKGHAVDDQLFINKKE